MTTVIMTDKVVDAELLSKQIKGLIGEYVVQEIRRLINVMDLKSQRANYLQSIQSTAIGDGVRLYSDVPYAVYLEYGTYSYWMEFGENRFPDPVNGGLYHPKKKDMPPAYRKMFPKGMQPFAPFRRVLYNTQRFENIVARAVRDALSMQ